MVVAGIDPGKKGGLFVLSDVDDLQSFAYTIPILKLMDSSSKLKEKPDYANWEHNWSQALKCANHVYIEQVHAMPGQGVTSMFSFGQTFGFMHCIVVASGIPYTFISPQKWKKLANIPPKSSGDDSRNRASQLLPQHSHLWTRKKDDGIAEAALIAYIGNLLLKGLL